MLILALLPQLQMIISSVIEAIVSEGRLVSFLAAEELQPDARRTITITSDEDEPRKGDELVSIRNASFKWSASADEETLKNVSLSVKKGELVAILGRVGDGKVRLFAIEWGGRRRGRLTYCLARFQFMLI